MKFLKSLIESKPKITESVSFEDLLLAQLEKQTSKLVENENPQDVIKVDIPLFLRLLEYAREDAKTDMDLHTMTDKLTKVCSDGTVAGMEHYEHVTKHTDLKEMPKEESLDLSMIRSLAGLK
jgi:hypothetical protein